jgi:hypothetical protein
LASLIVVGIAAFSMTLQAVAQMRFIACHQVRRRSPARLVLKIDEPPQFPERPRQRVYAVKGPRSALDADASESQHRKPLLPVLPQPAPQQLEPQVRLRRVR